MRLFQTLHDEDTLRNSQALPPPPRGRRIPDQASATASDPSPPISPLTSHGPSANSGWRLAHGGAPPIPPANLGEASDSNPLLFPPLRLSESHQQRQGTTTALSLSDLWGSSLADITFLASCGVLSLDNVPGTGYSISTDQIPTQLEMLRSAVISVHDLVDIIASSVTIHPDMLGEVIQAHNISTFQFYGMLHILRQDIPRVLSVLVEGDADGDAAETFADYHTFDTLPMENPNFTCQTSDEMRDMIQNGFTSFESPGSTISLSDLASRWGMSVDDVNFLVDANIIRATPPSRPTENWTVPTASVPDMQVTLENSLTDVRGLCEMLGDPVNVKNIIIAAGMRIIIWGEREFILTSDQNRAIDACLSYS